MKKIEYKIKDCEVAIENIAKMLTIENNSTEKWNMNDLIERLNSKINLKRDLENCQWR